MPITGAKIKKLQRKEERRAQFNGNRESDRRKETTCIVCNGDEMDSVPKIMVSLNEDDDDKENIHGTVRTAAAAIVMANEKKWQFTLYSYVYIATYFANTSVSRARSPFDMKFHEFCS